MFLSEKSLSRRRGGTGAAKCVLSGVLILFVSFLVLGCQEPNDTLTSLDGKWVSEYGETFIIDFADMSYKNPANSDWGDYTVEGDIRGIVYFNNRTAGIIYIEITKKGDDFAASSDTDKYTGVYFRYTNSTTVEFSTASQGTYPDAKTPTYSTLAAAKQALKADSVGTYFAMGSACTKQ